MLKAHVSSVKLCHRRDVFHCSHKRHSEVKVNLPDFRKLTVIGLVAERNAALERAGVCGEEVIRVP